MGMNRTVTKIKFIQAFKEKGIIFFDATDLKKIFGLKNKDTIRHLLTNLNHQQIIKRIKKGRYLFLFANTKPTDFSIANNIIIPSYISLESALSYYGLLDQFPYRITSITLTKPRQFRVDNKEFVYSKIKKEYFKDFIRIDDFLIASKEKVLFDYFYFIYKGLRPKNIGQDLKKFLNSKKVKEYFNENASVQFKNFLSKNAQL